MNILTSLPSPDVNYFEVGAFQIRYYAILILIGIVLAIWMAAVRLKRNGVEAGIALDVAIYAVPIGIIGARFYHVLTHLNDYFGKPGVDPISALYIWEGGIAIYGGLIFGTLGAWLAARNAGVRFLAIADAFAPGLILAQAIGRWGNYFNNELFGVPTDLPWGLQISSANPAYPVGLPDGVLFHPTFLYESIWDLAGVFVLLALEKRFKLAWGRLFAAYLVYYSTGRALIESIRIDPANIFLGIRTNVWSALAGIAIGLLLLWWSKRAHPGIMVSSYLPGKSPLERTSQKKAAKQAKKKPAEDYDFAVDEVNLPKQSAKAKKATK